MQSCTGCIYVTFLQCVFSNVSWNHLPEMMHSCNGCTCLTFLCCVILNELSKPFYKRMQCHTGFICLFLSIMCFQLPTWEDAKLHWLHLLDFHPLCVFRCLVKLPVWVKAIPHWLHLFDFSPLCVVKWILKWPVREDAYGFTIVANVCFYFLSHRLSCVECHKYGGFSL